jgi:hypothetical protein
MRFRIYRSSNLDQDVASETAPHPRAVRQPVTMKRTWLPFDRKGAVEEVEVWVIDLDTLDELMELMRGLEPSNNDIEVIIGIPSGSLAVDHDGLPFIEICDAYRE